MKKEVLSGTPNETKPQVWRVIGIFALVFVAVQLSTSIFGVGINFLMSRIGASENARVFIGASISRAGMIASALLVCVPVIRKVFQKDASLLLYPFSRKSGMDLLAGLGFSALAMAALFIIELAIGWLKIERWAFSVLTADAALRALWLALLVNLVAAVGEEFLFRGVLVTGLKDAWDAPGALFISSVIFGASHILVSGARQTSWLIFIPLLALPGLMLGWAYLRTGNLWLATGIHFGWNFFQDNFFNLAARTNADSLVGFATIQSGPGWVIGTEFGIEVGLAGIFALLLVSTCLWYYTKKCFSSTQEKK